MTHLIASREKSQEKRPVQVVLVDVNAGVVIHVRTGSPGVAVHSRPGVVSRLEYVLR
jgi:hypothetical protein